MTNPLNSATAAAAATPYQLPAASSVSEAATPKMSTSPSGPSQATETVKQKAKQAVVSKEEWAQFTRFYLQFGQQSGMPEFDLSQWTQRLNALFSKYTMLLKRPKDEKEAKHFADQCWMLATVFLHLVEINLQKQQGSFFDPSDHLKRRQYDQDTIHPHYCTFQKMTNLLATRITKTKLCETIYSIEIDQRRHLALVDDSQGYIPVPYTHTTKETQLVLVHWGDKILTPPEGCHELLLFFDCGRFEERDGFIIEMKRLPLTDAPVMTLYGVQNHWKSLLTVHSHPDPADPLVRTFAKYLDEEIKFFTLRTALNHEVFFIPLPRTPQEEREFTYLLLDMMKERKEPFNEEILSELEKEMRQRIENEQQARRQAVIAGTTQGAGGKRGKGGKKAAPKHQAPGEDPVEQAFKRWKVERRLKYQRLLRIAQQILKEKPDVLQSVTQAGSHLSLHTAAGVATVARRDEVSPTSANNFIREVLKAVKGSLL